MSIVSAIELKLIEALKPEVLVVENESHNHSVPAGSETHFKVVAVSDVFSGMNLVARHRKIYSILDHELKNGVHALALHTFTSEEWKAKPIAEKSPLCHSKK